MSLSVSEIKAMGSSVRMDWETPPALFARYDAEFHFTLDVAADAGNTKCPRYFDRDADGLAQDWSGDVCWMNPPYGRAIPKWMEKAYTESLKGATVVCLVPSRTDTRWWHEWAMKGEVRFIKGRITFVGAKTGGLFPSAIVVFRPAQSQKAVA